MIAALAPNQGSSRVLPDLFYAAQEYEMVPCFNDVLHAARQSCNHALDQRNSAMSFLPRQSFESLFVGVRRKPHREILLLLAQYIDRKVFRVAQLKYQPRTLVDANQNQRRLQRHRSE
jgi:hypothetical protein